MSKSYFAFKQFTVFHDRCAMKVGTDGVLLGAWADVNSATKILDIGAGTGLIALMLAQRCGASITTIDIDENAVSQAKDNIRVSPWADRVVVMQQDIRLYHPNESFDCIVSNPPYFIDSLKSPDLKRNMARHTDCLSFQELLKSVSILLSAEGCFSVILPYTLLDNFWSLAMEYRLYPTKQLLVMSKQGTLPKRVMVELKKTYQPCHIDKMVMEESPGVYSDAFRTLVEPFYLRL